MLYGGAGDDIIAGGDQFPTYGGYENYVHVPGMNTIEGGAGNDILYAQTEDTNIYGAYGFGPYAYRGGVKADGGEGIDFLVINLSHISSGITLDWRDPAKLISLADGTSIQNVERFHVTTGDGDDTLLSGRYTDAIFTGGGNDTVTIDALAMDLESRVVKRVDLGAGDDRLFVTDAEPDHLGLHGGALYGGDGFDRLIADYRSRTDRLIIAPPEGFEALDVQAGSGSDQIIGGQTGSNTLFGNAGDDIVSGGEKSDVLSGGADRDQIYGVGGNDVIDGDDSDLIDAGEGDDLVVMRNIGAGTGSAAGGAGTDTLSASGDLTQFKYSGFEILGADLVSQNLRISAEALNAFSRVHAQAITLATAGKVGANFLATAGAGRLIGSAGDDTIDLTQLKAAWTVSGEAGDDDITTGTGSDMLTGGAGNDSLDGGSGADRLEGGAGNDLYYVDDKGDRVIEAKGGGTDTILTSIDWTLAEDAHVEELLSVFQTATPFITLTGNSANNVLGGEGFDTLIGRKGDDTYLVNAGGDRVIEARSEGFDEVLTITSYTLAAGQEIEALGFLRSEKYKFLIDIESNEWRYTAINLTGNEFAQTITGNDGNNVLDGRGGADTLVGGIGNDTYRIDNAKDVVVETAGQGTDTVLTTVSYALKVGQQVEILQTADAKATTALKLTGNEFANTLIGNAGANVLDGGAGIDEMRGGAGNDTYLVDNARDRVIETAKGGTDTVITTVSYALAAGQEIERLQATSGKAKLDLTGNAFGQTLVGNAGTNVIDGGLGTDLLTGGAGADTFVFSMALGSGNVDHITDFVLEDTIRLSKSVFKALAPSQLKSNEFKDIAKAKIDADDHILYDSRNGKLFYDVDGSGSKAAVQIAVLDNKAAITHADFLIG